MTRTQRTLWTLAVALSGVLAIVGLTYVGDRSRGPLGTLLSWLGARVSSTESRVVQRFRGPGRAVGLRWLEPYRADAARLRRPDPVLLGAFDGGIPQSLEGVTALEDSLGVAFPLIHAYTAWGDKPEQQFPLRIAGVVWELGSIPVITWEPWLIDFDAALHPHLPTPAARDRGGLAAIARGDYDFYIDRWAADAARFAKPILLRFGHEMNDAYRYPWGPQNNRPRDFSAAWRHLVDRFRRAGAANVLWVWSPHIAVAGYDAFYPGDDVVDWVATGVLNYGTVARWSEWWTFEEIFGDRYDGVARHAKPIMIAELGSLAVGGDRAAWFRQALERLPERYPAVKAVLFFHVERDATVTLQPLEWAFVGDSATTGAVARAIAPWAPASAGGKSEGGPGLRGRPGR